MVIVAFWDIAWLLKVCGCRLLQSLLHIYQILRRYIPKDNVPQIVTGI